MGFLEAVKHVFQNYATFDGRARRSEYWYFTLFNTLVNMVGNALTFGIASAGFVGALYDNKSAFSAGSGIGLIFSALLGIYGLAAIIPGLAVQCRRLHDVGKPGAYMLFVLIPIAGPILLLVWDLQDSEPRDNQYGPYPKSNNPYNYQQVTAPIYPVAPAVSPAPVRHTLPGLRYAIRALSGPLQGHVFPIDRGEISFGRLHGNTIQFPVETQGVSKQHCILASRGDVFALMDLSSSCGTYLAPSNRIPANSWVPITVGTKFYLGSMKNCFELIRY